MVTVAETFSAFGCTEEVPVRPGLSKTPVEVPSVETTMPVKIDPMARAKTQMEKIVLDLYYKHVGNITAMHKAIRDMGITFSRDSVEKTVDAMGLDRLKRPRKK